MGRGGPQGDGLLKKAVRDFELARRYKDAKELVTASLLYNSAIERVLKALVIAKTRKNPPKSASISYLATQARLPAEIHEEIISLEDEASEMMEEELEIEKAEEDTRSAKMYNEYNKVLDKGSVVRRLISYAEANK
ncbi:MAG TPA: HEPN domain-containing protein [Candidatus Acidoferrum sp.]|nr:HEPN domain-containing protein [Candidatus Acidoferrum sp.]